MDSQIESHELSELSTGLAEHVGEVRTVVETGHSVGKGCRLLVAIVVDDSGNARDLCAEVESVFEGGFPVLALVHTVGVGLCEVGVGLAHQDTC